jgi:hypothetical protein
MDQTNDISSDTIVENVAVGEKRDAAYDRVAIAAYFIWLSEGCPEGRDQAHWHEAELKLSEQLAP